MGSPSSEAVSEREVRLPVDADGGPGAVDHAAHSRRITPVVVVVYAAALWALVPQLAKATKRAIELGLGSDRGGNEAIARRAQPAGHGIGRRRGARLQRHHHRIGIGGIDTAEGRMPAITTLPEFTTAREALPNDKTGWEAVSGGADILTVGKFASFQAVIPPSIT